MRWCGRSSTVTSPWATWISVPAHVSCVSHLVPRSLAYKRIEGGRYRFEVAFTLPVFGRLLRYGGLLDAAAEPPAL